MNRPLLLIRRSVARWQAARCSQLCSQAGGRPRTAAVDGGRVGQVGRGAADGRGRLRTKRADFARQGFGVQIPASPPLRARAFAFLRVFGERRFGFRAYGIANVGVLARPAGDRPRPATGRRDSRDSHPAPARGASCGVRAGSWVSRAVVGASGVLGVLLTGTAAGPSPAGLPGRRGAMDRPRGRGILLPTVTGLWWWSAQPLRWRVVSEGRRCPPPWFSRRHVERHRCDSRAGAGATRRAVTKPRPCAPGDPAGAGVRREDRPRTRPAQRSARRHRTVRRAPRHSRLETPPPPARRRGAFRCDRGTAARPTPLTAAPSDGRLRR